MQKDIFVLVGVVILVVGGIFFFTRNSPENNMTTGETLPINNLNNSEKIMSATLHTSKGDIKIEFFEAQTPKTVANFLKLAKEGFYNGTKFHRVIKGFMIQGGDPLSKDDIKIDLWGTGGPGYTVPAEIKLKNTIGTVATARLGDNINPKKDSSGSQFFINTVDNPFLDNNYTVFGKIVSGMDVVTKIENAPTLLPGTADRPASAVVIESISLE